jgi:hypothetical protein
VPITRTPNVNLNTACLPFRIAAEACPHLVCAMCIVQSCHAQLQLLHPIEPCSAESLLCLCCCVCCVAALLVLHHCADGIILSSAAKLAMSQGSCAPSLTVMATPSKSLLLMGIFDATGTVTGANTACGTHCVRCACMHGCIVQFWWPLCCCARCCNVDRGTQPEDCRMFSLP